VIIARRCWLDLQEQRRRLQIPLRKLAIELRRRFPQDAPAHTTLQDWLVNRKSLPDKPLFLAFVGLLELDEKNWADRWEQWDRARLALPTASGDRVEVPAPARHLATVTDDEPRPDEGRRGISIDWQPRALIGAAVVLVAAVGVGGVFLPSDGSGAGVISAVAANRAAHAEFHRDEARFLVFDDLIDSRSAILQMAIDGSDVETLYNSKGVTGAKHPPKIVDVPGLVDDDTAVAFRVCAGEYGHPVPEESCGAWTTDQSR
jgi:hypothetical protein